MAPDSEYSSSQTDKKCLKLFADKYLCQDGVFLLRLMGRNISDVMLCEVVTELYILYKKEYYKKDKSSLLLSTTEDEDKR